MQPQVIDTVIDTLTEMADGNGTTFSLDKIDWQTLTDKAVEWLITSGLHILIIVILMLVALKVARWLSNKIIHAMVAVHDLEGEMQKRIDTLNAVIRYVLVIAVGAVGLVMILGEFGIQIGPILAAAGVVGLAIGFGSQQLVQDVITGFFILVEDQIRVGDVVQIAGKGGLVEKVNLRMVVLRDLAGNVHYVRNGQIDVITNMTKEYSRYVFDIGVAYREDVDTVIEVIRDVDKDLRGDDDYKNDILDEIEILGLDQFADSAVIIKARYTTKPIKQWRVAREFNRRLKKAFDEKDIEIPFPHTTLYLGANKDGTAPPLHVMMEKASSESDKDKKSASNSKGDAGEDSKGKGKGDDEG